MNPPAGSPAIAVEAAVRAIRLVTTSAVGVGLAERGGAGPGSTSTTDTDLASHAARLEATLADLLEIDRVVRTGDVGAAQSLDLAQLVHQAVKGLPRSRGVEIDVPGTMPWHGHHRRTARILDHLIANAVDHTPESAEISIRGEPDGSGWTITVIDTGPGVPEELRGRIFEPFARGADMRRSSGPRLGLGLTVAAQFAAIHGGQVTNASRGPDDGGRFQVTFPAQQRQGHVHGQLHSWLACRSSARP